MWDNMCRSFLSTDKTKNGWNNIARAKNYKPNKTKYYGRNNKGVTTLNLPYIALEAIKDMQGANDLQKLAAFWAKLDEYAELCREAALIHVNQLANTPSDVAPILWQHGALARLNEGESIAPLLYNGYSTTSLGFAGGYECVQALIGKSHTSEEGAHLMNEILKHLNDLCDKWNEKDNIGWGTYGTPQL